MQVLYPKTRKHVGVNPPQQDYDYVVKWVKDGTAPHPPGGFLGSCFKVFGDMAYVAMLSPVKCDSLVHTVYRKACVWSSFSYPGFDGLRLRLLFSFSSTYMTKRH